MLNNHLKIFAVLAFCFVLFKGFGQQQFFDKFSTIKPISHQENQAYKGWENYFFSTDDCKCVYGDDFFIAIKEALEPSKNLMISLQGGGACWPGTIQCKSNATDEDLEKARFISQLEAKLPERWHQVFIPYCDGSVYMGDKAQDYDNNKQIDHWHDGLKISVASLSFVKKKVPIASKIFITGCSAGGYGTIFQLRLLRYLYPNARIYVLNESGPGLFRPDDVTRETINTAWNLNQLVPENCERCEEQLIYWYDQLLEDPRVKIGLYSSYIDEVIGQSFLRMQPKEYKSLLLGTSGDLNAAHPKQFKRFFINGNTHCVADRYYKVKGMSYWDWILAFLNDDPTWVDTLE